MRNDQLKYLKIRFAEAQRLARSRTYDKHNQKEPAHVKRAKAVVDQWYRTSRQARDRAIDACDRTMAKFKEALLFNDANKALEAVKAAEKYAASLK